MNFRRALAILLFLILLAPATWFAWHNRSMAQFGQYHDDAIYFISAKSLAEGTGYRIPSMPENPPQTKYPPLLPGLLALVWLLNPKFPDNLVLATVLQWTAIPLLLGLSLAWFRKVGLAHWQSWTALAILATQPYTVVMSAGIYTEVLFAVLLLFALLALEKAASPPQPWPWALAGGILIGLAYLTRTSGIVCIVAIPGVFLLWRMWRQAAVSLLGMLPAVAGWTLWTRAHRMPPKDLYALYNTDYVAFQFLNVRLSDVQNILWTNLGHLFYEVGALLFPQESDSMFMPFLRVTIAVGIFMGLYRNRHRRALHLYLAVMLLMLIELVVWPSPPDLRVMYPLIPVFLAGLLWEAEHFLHMLQANLTHHKRSSRVAGWVVGGAAAVLVLLGAKMQVSMLTQDLPEQAAYFAGLQRDHAAVCGWLNEHGGANQNVLAANPSLYLYTGRRTEALLISPVYFYRTDKDAVVRQVRTVPEYARRGGLHYVYMHEGNYGGLFAGAADDSRRAIRSDPALQVVFQSGQATLYQLTNEPAPAPLP